MSSFTKTLTTTFKVVTCYTCSIPFGITSQLYRRVVTNAEGSVYCPSCGNRSCWRESQADKEVRLLKVQQAKLERDAAYQRQEQTRLRDRIVLEKNKARAQKAAKTRLKNRIAKGVCPCCNRHFSNVHQHIQKQHPTYLADDSR